MTEIPTTASSLTYRRKIRAEFDFDWEKTLDHEYNIQQLVDSWQTNSGGHINDNTYFATVKARVKSVGRAASDYVGLLFLSSDNAGPTPRPNKSLVSYLRLTILQSEANKY